MGNKLASKTKPAESNNTYVNKSTSSLLMRYIAETKSSFTIPSDDFNFIKHFFAVQPETEKVHYTVSLMNQIYTKYVQEHKPKRLTIPRSMIHKLRAFLCVIRETAETSKDLSECLKLDETDLWENFDEYLLTSPLDLQVTVKDEQIARHNLCVLHICDMILNCYERGPKDVYELYKMIGISHMIMGIPQSKFWEMRDALYKFAINNGLINDNNIKEVSILFQVIMKNIVMFMKIYCDELQDHNYGNLKQEGRNLIARQHFRLMRQWRIIVNKMREKTARSFMVASQLQQKPSDDNTIPTIILKQKDWIMKHFVKNPDTNSHLSK